MHLCNVSSTITPHFGVDSYRSLLRHQSNYAFNVCFIWLFLEGILTAKRFPRLLIHYNDSPCVAGFAAAKERRRGYHWAFSPRAPVNYLNRVQILVILPPQEDFYSYFLTLTTSKPELKMSSSSRLKHGSVISWSWIYPSLISMLSKWKRHSRNKVMLNFWK